MQRPLHTEREEDPTRRPQLDFQYNNNERQRDEICRLLWRTNKRLWTPAYTWWELSFAGWVPVCLNLGFLRFLPLDLLPFLDCGDPAKMEDTSLCFEAGRFRFWVKWEIQMILRFVNCMCGERGGYLDSITIGKCF